MSDVHDLLRISPTIKSYLNSALSSFSDDGLMEDLRGFESELPGSADRGDEDIRLSVAIDRAVEFVDPMRQVVIWRFLNEFPIPARHRGGIIDPLTDQQVLGWAWNDAKPGWMMERPYHSYYSWAYGVMAQEIASQVRECSGAYRRYRRQIDQERRRITSHAITAVADLALARERANSAFVVDALQHACLADPSLSDSVPAIILQTVDEMLGIETVTEKFKASRERAEAAWQGVEEAQKRLQASSMPVRQYVDELQAEEAE